MGRNKERMFQPARRIVRTLDQPARPVPAVAAAVRSIALNVTVAEPGEEAGTVLSFPLTSAQLALLPEKPFAPGTELVVRGPAYDITLIVKG